MELLDPERIAAGQQLGKELFQAGRVASALETTNPGAESVSLRARIDFCKRVELLTASKIASLQAAELSEVMEEVLPQLENHPAELKVNILRSSMRVQGIPSNETAVKNWLSQVLPGRLGCCTTESQTAVFFPCLRKIGTLKRLCAESLRHLQCQWPRRDVALHESAHCGRISEQVAILR